MSQEILNTSLDLALQKVYEESKATLLPDNGESLVVAKVENGKFASAVFAKTHNAALTVIQFLYHHPDVFQSFISQLAEVPEFNLAYRAAIVHTCPDEIIELLRERFLVFAIPHEANTETKLDALDKLRTIILDNGKSAEEAQSSGTAEKA